MTDTFDEVSLEELEQLQRELDAVQAAASSTKLSRRNCVQIVMKLQEMHLIDLLYTLDGKEYLTPDHLKRELQDEIYVHHGRLNVIDLQELCNVDLLHIEKKVAELVDEDDSLYRIQGELINSDALDNIAVEVNGLLQQAGQLDVVALGQRFSLPADFLTPHVHARVGAIIKGSLQNSGNEIVTEKFRNRQLARVMGHLRGITRPVSIASLKSRYGIKGTAVEECMKVMIASGELKGSLKGKGDKATFIPAIHSQTQEKWIDAFFRENGYFEYDKALSLGITNGEEYLQQRFPGAIPLSSCIIADHVVESANAQLEDALTAGDDLVVDIAVFLPPVCTEADIEAILKQSQFFKRQKNLQLINGTVVMKTDIVDTVKKMFMDDMSKKGKSIDAELLRLYFDELSSKSSQSASSSSSTSSTAASSSSSKKKRGRKGKRGNKKDDEDDEDAPKKHTSATSTSGASNASHESFKPSKKLEAMIAKCGTQAPFSAYTVDEMEDAITGKYKMLEDYPGVARNIAESLHPALERDYHALLASRVEKGTASSRKEKRPLLEAQFNSMIEVALSFNATAQSIHALGEDDDPNSEQYKKLGENLEKHLLRTLCLDLTNTVIKLFAIEVGLPIDVDAPMTSAARKEILKSASSDEKKAVTQIMDLTKGKSMDDFVSALRPFAEGRLQLFVRDFNKKVERNALEYQERALRGLMESMTNTTSLGEALLVAVSLLFVQKRKQCVHAQGKDIPLLITLLKGRMGDDDFAMVSKAQDDVYEMLTNKGGVDFAPSVAVDDLRRIVGIVDDNHDANEG